MAEVLNVILFILFSFTLLSFQSVDYSTRRQLFTILRRLKIMAMQKFIANDLALRKVPDPDVQLLESLEDIITSFPPTDEPWKSSDGSIIEKSFNGLYIGPTAFAYLFLQVSKSHPDLAIKAHPASYWAALYLSIPRPTPTRDEEAGPENCGILNEPLCFLAVSAAVKQDPTHVDAFLSLLRTAGIYNSGGWNDWCYGRAGTLYLLRLMRTWLPSSTTSINTAISEISTLILTHGPPFIYRGRRGLGAGHGEIGILTQLVLSAPNPQTFIANTPKVTQILQDLLDLQLPSGNWVHSPEKPDELVQFCHGAPGFAISLTSMLTYFPSALQTRMKTAIEAARAVTWTRGILTKEPNLCHGTEGNAFAFPPGPQREHFLSFCTKVEVESGLKDGTYEKCDYGLPFALGFGGPGGRPWGWLARDRVADVYIGYNDI